MSDIICVNVSPVTKLFRHFLAHRTRQCLLLLGWGLSLLPGRARSENHADYRYEYYGEADNRITVNTHSAYFQQQIIENIMAHAELTYDGVSGATPTGAKPIDGKIPMTHMSDIRRAASLDLDLTWGKQTFTPKFAYSKESDYESFAVALTDAIEFNEKNTTLTLGVGHHFDSVLNAASPRVWQYKNVTEGFLGISQLLSPTTILAGTVTLGAEDGYLSDPYRLASFDTFDFAYHENRPGYKMRETFLLSVMHHFLAVRGTLQASYRFYHDSYEIFSHTLNLTWSQWLGKHVLIEPRFRFAEQSSAYFYNTSFPGIGPSPNQIYSADYRLSELYTLDYGVQATVIATHWLRFVAGYHRYEMYGLDQTASGMYPKANIVTAGLQIWY